MQAAKSFRAELLLKGLTLLLQQVGVWLLAAVVDLAACMGLHAVLAPPPLRSAVGSKRNCPRQVRVPRKRFTACLSRGCVLRRTLPRRTAP